MGLLIGLGVQFDSKPESGNLGRGIADRVRRTIDLKPENGIPTPWDCSPG